MAVNKRRVIQRRRPVATPGQVDIHRKLTWEYVDINDIRPYEFNARDNAEAIPAVAESIKAFGFLVPVVLDRNNELGAGHTRYGAAKLLGMDSIPALRAEHLTPEQMAQFRLIDNKVSEIAKWDFDLLSAEISKLADSGIDWTNFGWSQEEIDCLSEVVAADCLDAVTAAGEAAAAAPSTQARRAPVTARFVLGEVVFFIPATQYRVWVDGLRNLHDLNETAIVADIKRRLGIME